MFFIRYLLCLFLGRAYSWGCAYLRVNTVFSYQWPSLDDMSPGSESHEMSHRLQGSLMLET